MFSVIGRWLSDALISRIFSIHETNRMAFYVYRKQPFFDWLNGVEPDHLVKLDTSNQRGNAYLVKDIVGETPAHFEDYLKVNWLKIWFIELGDFHCSSEVWPQEPTYEMFKEWFSYEMPESCYDLSRGRIKRRRIR